MAPASTDGRADPGRSTAPATAAGVAASLAVLVLTAPPPGTAVAELAGAASSSDPLGPLLAAVSLLAWALSGWLLLTVGLVLLSRLPGLLGRAGGAVARRVAPTTVRRAVEATLGLTVAVGALAPSAALAVPAPATSTAAARGVPGTEVVWELDWPSRTATPPPSRAPVASRASVTAPGTAPTASAPPPAPTTPPPAPPGPPSAAPHATATAPPTATAPTTTTTPAPQRPAVRASPATSPSVVVVRPGDSLWALAEQALRRTGADPTDRQVAQAWPRWWAANREVVGDDPDLLLPGTVLRPPPTAGAT